MPNSEPIGIHARIHVMFWVLCGLVAVDSLQKDIKEGLVPMIVGVLALLIFGFGHGWAHAISRRRHGAPGSLITLNGLGARVSGPGQFTKFQHLKNGLAGPIFNLIFAGIAYALLASPWVIDPSNPLRMEVAPEDLTRAQRALGDGVRMILFVNLFLGLLNLLPIRPLDGGHILDPFLSEEGSKILPWVGLILGALLTAFGIVSGRLLMPFIFFLVMVHNFLLLRGRQIRAF